MLYGVKIYDKNMKLIKEISKEEIRATFWDDKENILAPNPHMKFNRRVRRARAREAEFKNTNKGAIDESTTKRNNTKRQGKKRVRRSGRAR